MQPKLTVQERLKDLRVVDFDLTLEELAERTGLSRSALGKYESDETAKDISPYAILTLAKFYGVSTDYLLGLTENKNHPNTELNALHLSDDAITVLTTGNFNHRLLSEMICHKDFQRMMLDAEIYVDRIADMRITNMNAAMEAVRQSVIKKKGNDDNCMGWSGCSGVLRNDIGFSDCRDFNHRNNSVYKKANPKRLFSKK